MAGYATIKKNPRCLPVILLFFTVRWSSVLKTEMKETREHLTTVMTSRTVEAPNVTTVEQTKVRQCHTGFWQVTSTTINENNKAATQWAGNRTQLGYHLFSSKCTLS